jgi:hypothetical protein
MQIVRVIVKTIYLTSWRFYEVVANWFILPILIHEWKRQSVAINERPIENAFALNVSGVRRMEDRQDTRIMGWQCRQKNCGSLF